VGEEATRGRENPRKKDPKILQNEATNSLKTKKNGQNEAKKN